MRGIVADWRRARATENPSRHPFGTALRRALRRAAAYRIIDAHTEIHGTTWLSGSCAVLAAALVRWWPGFRKVWIADAHGVVHHALVSHDGLYFDADGASREPELLERWRRVEGLSRPRIVSRPGALARDHCPAAAVREVEAFLREKIGTPSTWGFRRRG